MAATGAAAQACDERFLALDCAGETCIAVYAPPAPGSQRAGFGVVIVVGGPQYRVGSHRQFVLLARDLACDGIPVLRFDYRGMGDSSGEARTFEAIDVDIAAAVDALARESGARRVVLWGLCDGASAALMYASGDARVAGVVAVNPWAHTPEREARTLLRHHYLRRLVSADFWRRLVAGRVDLKRSGSGLREAIGSASRGVPSGAQSDYLRRMRDGWQRFRGPMLLVLSGEDYTAREFEDWVGADTALRRLLDSPRTRVRRFGDADHTFSTRAWRDAVSEATRTWLREVVREPERANAKR